MEKKEKFDLSKFEALSQNQQGQLVGGFSAATDPNDQLPTDPVTNNCNGGNCVSGCQTNKLVCT